MRADGRSEEKYLGGRGKGRHPSDGRENTDLRDRSTHGDAVAVDDRSPPQ